MLQRGSALRAVSSGSNRHEGEQTPEIVDKRPETSRLYAIVRWVVTGELVLFGQANLHRRGAETLRRIKAKLKPEGAEIAEAAETQGLRVLTSLRPCAVGESGRALLRGEAKPLLPHAIGSSAAEFTRRTKSNEFSRGRRGGRFLFSLLSVPPVRNRRTSSIARLRSVRDCCLRHPH